MYARSSWARIRRTVVGAAALVVLFAVVPSAHAGPLVDSVTSCDNQVLETPFRRWGDPATYVLAPNGTAENAARWTLAGGAGRALGNEIYYVHATGDRYSLDLPPGSSATTASICVGLDRPTLRFLARNDGSPSSVLHCEVLFEDILGSVHSLPIGDVVGVAQWQPPSPLPVIANLVPLVPGGGTTAVAFRFTPDRSGDWSIDDVYVDPWRHG